MKLTELRSALRNHMGNPSIQVELVPGHPMTVVLQKTAFDKEIARTYGNERGAETGLTFHDGLILPVISTLPAGGVPPSPQPTPEDDDDGLL